MRKFVLLPFLLMLAACTTQELARTVDILTGTDAPLTESEVTAGLREALINGITRGADEVSQQGGYLNDPIIRIPFPPEVQKVENTLRDIGMGALVDDFVQTMNRGAEEAATAAKPIFVDAIRNMTITDAFAILSGDKDEATRYLERTTRAQLRAAFRPIINAALEETGATKHYGKIVSTYNAIPLVQPVDPDLAGYATDRAIEGLFVKIADEEQRIRENPAARTSELLRRVFGQAQ